MVPFSEEREDSPIDEFPLLVVLIERFFAGLPLGKEVGPFISISELSELSKFPCWSALEFEGMISVARYTNFI